MRAFRCRVCGNALYFENSVCTSCGTPLGFSRAEGEIVPVDSTGRYVDPSGVVWHVCRNLGLSGCTWLAAVEGGECSACDLTRVRPNDADLEGLSQYPVAERAKRWLLFELDRLGFAVVGKAEDPEKGLCFDLLSSVQENVVIGHDAGVITIDLAESDDAYRVKVQKQLGEPYRTMLGHFRHEVGHYVEWLLVENTDRVAEARTLFGDERADYQAEIDRHYSEGPPAGWQARYISTYSTMHPYEDFAETWAHFLHITDTLETADQYGLATFAGVDAFATFRDVVTEVWMPLATGLNMINRSMGKSDLYPFLLPDPVLEKLDFVASLRREHGA
ncbi:zinc-binding metallopeptidase family protein [Microbacterium sp. Clip185]|uniref:zinc-binding metallopeptidase family protein n=1 Tax=Microbacterium sp. Clip185 TaxID=3025663 RepID=UPI0023655F7F|nr:putative zinc-binding metallopeptidase [Microbacterium sp. Clip185]WDG19272.1 putative zinc-binding metallopeptidase [Microbacterium sp. Clip185]